MSRVVRLGVAIGVLAGVMVVVGDSPAAGQGGGCTEGVQESGALYLICVPEESRGDLVVWAHGYVSPFAPLEVPDDEIAGVPLSEIINRLGFAYATTSYSKNGLAIKQGVADVVDLVDIFEDDYGAPDRVLLVGASEGGIVTTLAIEKHAEVFDGGVAACGPIGSFQEQINYFGDFRGLFDILFPGIIPGSPLNVPQFVIDNWDEVYVPQVKAAVAADPQATEQLLAVSGAATDPDDPSTVEETVLGVLWYAIHATNDGNETLGGQPYDNTTRVYRGSDRDLLLNLLIPRISADPEAVAEMGAHYETSGELSVPLVTMHTAGDEIVPYFHEPRYRLKTLLSGDAGLHRNLKVERYGHCNFTAGEALLSLARLLVMLGPEE